MLLLVSVAFSIIFILYPDDLRLASSPRRYLATPAAARSKATVRVAILSIRIGRIDHSIEQLLIPEHAWCAPELVFFQHQQHGKRRHFTGLTLNLARAPKPGRQAPVLDATVRQDVLER
ncbi:hypothetical protein CH063_12084 [Colletotrichum higginsianum]|uniref:Secreted protein n=1 Tax=Colletotrichum higginsianum (strain IMI 349063) TaxID=759273 RepID=H1VP10_COLHI|nr:hypothetical protein CH063_12084 [Colletotrichum higginsianum]